MTWLCNRWHEETITAYNEEEATDMDGGLERREKTDDVEMEAFVIETGSMFFHGEDGRFVSEGLVFQVSLKEMDDKSFEFKTGKSFLEYDGYTYRVMEITDYSKFPFTQLIECKAVKIVDVD